MGFMDKVLYSAKTFANTAGEVAGEVYEKGRYRVQLLGLNSDLEKAFTQLGRMEYERRSTGVDKADLMDACYAEIEDIMESIDTLCAEIAAMTGEKICPHCSETVVADAVYCPKCGARMDAQPAEAAEPVCTVEASEVQE